MVQRKKQPIDSLLSPEARGKRLKKLRQKSDLSRRAIEEKHGISARTWESWEKGGAGGLTEKGAMRVIYAMREEGIYCTKEWLLYGSGLPPQTVDENLQGSFEAGISNKNLAMPLDTDEETAIRQELLTFRQYNPNAIDARVMDDGMEPQYGIGDYIGGQRRFGEDIAACVNNDCIVETDSDEIYVRRLRAGSKQGLYSLYTVNPNTTVYMPVMQDISLKSAAPIIWHRRKNF